MFDVIYWTLVVKKIFFKSCFWYFAGELSRTHSKNDTSKHVANIQLGSMIFHAIAPLSPILFQWVNFKIFGMEINQYNAIGLFMILLTLVYQLMAYFFLTNLTREPGYQIFLKLEGLHDKYSKFDDERTERLWTY